MRVLISFWTFTCERCNRKESVPARLYADKTTAHPSLPPEWERISAKDFCEGCTSVIQEAMTK